MGTDTVRQQASIDAPPEMVATAIVSPHGLSTWMCDEAYSEQQEGGRLSLRWHDGRQVVGRWTAYAPPQELAWHWRDDTGADDRHVRFELEKEGQGTKVAARIEDLAEDELEAAAKEWRQYLEDLKLFVEQGVSGRVMRQPMLGIMPEEVDAAAAERMGLPVKGGMRIASLVPEGAAAAAGLAQDDVIVRIEEHDVVSWPSLNVALGAHRAGDTVNVRFWREGAGNDVAVTLKTRDMPRVPEAVHEIRDTLHRYTDEAVARIRGLFEGVTDAEAERKPAEGEWCAKEVLVHLSYSERFSSEWLMSMAGEGPLVDWPGQGTQLLADALGKRPVAELLDRFETDLRDYEALCMAALDADPTPWLRHTVAMSPHWDRMHLEDHLDQIQEAIEKARQTTG